MQRMLLGARQSGSMRQPGRSFQHLAEWRKQLLGRRRVGRRNRAVAQQKRALLERATQIRPRISQIFIPLAFLAPPLQLLLLRPACPELSEGRLAGLPAEAGAFAVASPHLKFEIAFAGVNTTATTTPPPSPPTTATPTPPPAAKPPQPKTPAT